MILKNVSKTLIVGLICMPGLSPADQAQNNQYVQGGIGGLTEYPPLQKSLSPPNSNDYAPQQSVAPMYPAATTDVPGDYPPLGYEPESRATTSRPIPDQSRGVQQGVPAQYPGSPAVGQPQVPYPYPSQGLNVWTPAIGGVPSPPPTAPPSAASARSDSQTPLVPQDSPSQPAPNQYPPLPGETSYGYPYSPTPNTGAPRYAQPYGAPPPRGGYGGYPPGPPGPYPPPPHYGRPPFPGPW